METHHMTAVTPHSVIRAAPRNHVLASFLAEHAQGSKAINHGQVVTVDFNAKPVYRVITHALDCNSFEDRS